MAEELRAAYRLGTLFFPVLWFSTTDKLPELAPV